MKKYIIILFSAALALCFSSSVSAAVYVVQKGDSLWSISKKLDIPFRELVALNSDIKPPSLIFPNQQIVIPNGSGVAEAPKPETDSYTEEATAVLSLVNKERSNLGLKPLTLSVKLSGVANVKSKDMASKGYFSHNSPTYGTPFDMLKKFGVSYRSAGENIAAGQRSPESVMKAWMNSSGHRANILNANYTELGVGFYKGGQYGYYWTQFFIGK